MSETEKYYINTFEENNVYDVLINYVDVDIGLL